MLKKSISTKGLYMYYVILILGFLEGPPPIVINCHILQPRYGLVCKGNPSFKSCVEGKS